MKRNHLTKHPKIAFLGILLGLVCFGSPLAAQEIVPVLDNDRHADSHTTQQHAGGHFNEVLGAGLPLPNTSIENTATGNGLVNTVLSLLALPWIVRALASGNAIWRAVNDGHKRKELKG